MLVFFSQSDQMIKMCLSLVGSIGTVMLPRVASMHSQGNQSAVETSIIKAFNIASGLSFALFFGILGISLKFASFFFLGIHFRWLDILCSLKHQLSFLFRGVAF